LKLLKGSYAFALLDKEDKGTIYVAKIKARSLSDWATASRWSLSDAMAMLQLTNQFVELMDQETVIVRKDHIEIYALDGTKIERNRLRPSWMPPISKRGRIRIIC